VGKVEEVGKVGVAREEKEEEEREMEDKELCGEEGLGGLGVEEGMEGPPSQKGE
jgi:hypothetical protein